MKKIESAGQLRRLLSQNEKCLVDFYAEWCGPCQIMKPILESIDDINIYSIDVDIFGKIASRYNVMTLPTIILFEKGKPVVSITGSQTKKDIEKLYK